MTSLKLKIFLLISAALILPRSVYGHDGWVQVNAIVEKGQPVSMCAHARQSLQRTWKFSSRRQMGCAQYTKLLVIDPSGKINDLTNTIVDLGEDPEKTGPKGPKGFHLAQFTPKTDGVYIAAGSTGAKPATRGRAQAAHDEKRQIGIRCAGQSEGRRGTKGERLRENLCAEQSFGDRPGEQSFQHD